MGTHLFYNHLSEEQRAALVEAVKPYGDFSNEWVWEVKKLLNPIHYVGKDQTPCGGCAICNPTLEVEGEEIVWTEDGIDLVISFIDDNFFEHDDSMSVSEEDDDDYDEEEEEGSAPVPLIAPPDSLRHYDLYFFSDSSHQWVPYTGAATVSTFAKLVPIPRGEDGTTHGLPKELMTHFDVAECEDDSGVIYCYTNAAAIKAHLNQAAGRKRKIEELAELARAAALRIEFLRLGAKPQRVPQHLKHFVGQPEDYLATRTGQFSFSYTATPKK